QKAASVPTCTVLREGVKRNIPSSELVVGDILILSEGDYITADARLIETNAFRCNELALTGEIVPVEKDATLVLEDMVPCPGRRNMVFAGCNVTHGSAKAVVVETGVNTEIAKIDTMTDTSKTAVSGIEKKLNNTSRIINIVVVVFCAIIFVIGMLFGLSTHERFAKLTLQTLLNAVALGVCAIPEGLPYVTVIVTALGAGRLIRDGVIIKNISTIEKLAKTTVLCADKTGVFTESTMSLAGVYNGESLESPRDGSLDQKSGIVLKLAVSCSMLENDSTEAAIEDACRKYTNLSKEEASNVYPRLSVIPFDGERKMMTSINMIDGKPFAVIKGAPEAVIEKCPDIDKAALLKVCDELANKALRLICIAIKALDEIPANPSPDEIENDLKFAGIICLEDPPRPEAYHSIQFCKDNGIEVIMVTGDNLSTACAVAKNLGVMTKESQAVSGAQLEEFSDDELKAKIKSYTVFARISPAQKLRIVNTLRDLGEIVTVTGNGLDDADVLSVADVGLAIGAKGNDVARGNSDAIIRGNKFSSLADIFKECHGLFENIKLTVRYLIGCNASELLIYLFTLLIFKIPPLLTVQLLCINLLTDAAPAIALTIRQPDEVSALKTSKLFKGRLFDKNTVAHIAVESIVLTLCGLFAFTIGNKTGLATAYTMTFLTMALSQVFHSLNLHSGRSIVFTKYRRNEFMIYSTIIAFIVCVMLTTTSAGFVFGLTALSASTFFTSFGLSLIIIPVCEIIKIIDEKMLKKE
ncbi:MAG: cation-translocating P-type ATPase, partial [Clostridia bacterium]|nr:cation-translocating P-type ATPase [Clostridia bacterium]